jgi:hypothetical protein
VYRAHVRCSTKGVSGPTKAPTSESIHASQSLHRHKLETTSGQVYGTKLLTSDVDHERMPGEHLAAALPTPVSQCQQKPPGPTDRREQPFGRCTSESVVGFALDRPAATDWRQRVDFCRSRPLGSVRRNDQTVTLRVNCAVEMRPKRRAPRRRTPAYTAVRIAATSGVAPQNVLSAEGSMHAIQKSEGWS